MPAPQRIGGETREA